MPMLALELFNDTLRQQNRLWCGILEYAGGARFADAIRLRIPRPWVAEVTNSGGRVFLPYRKDYSRANGSGSRGVMLWYELRDGHTYEVNAQVSWRGWDRYFCRIVGGQIERIPSAQVGECPSVD